MRPGLSALCTGHAVVACWPGGCKRDADGQLPEISGEKIAAKRATVQGFGLVAAYPDQEDDDELAIALEFSRPLVGTQEFDALIAVTDKTARRSRAAGCWTRRGRQGPALPVRGGQQGLHRHDRGPA